MHFYELMLRLHKTKVLSKLVNIRHLSEAIEIAHKESEIKEIILDSMLLWVERDYDGRPNEEQLSAIEAVVRKVYV